MKISEAGTYFEDYVSARPGTFISRFTDSEGATLLIPTALLVKMYELVKFDLERSGSWKNVQSQLNDETIAG